MSEPLQDLDEELSSKESIKKKCVKLYGDVVKSFEDQRKRSDTILDFWDCYNTETNYNAGYNGRSKVYVPIVHNAIEARTTRFVNQIFPTNGRYVEVVTENGDIPYAHSALIENYIAKAKLRTQVVPALCRNGDIEGQYTVYVSWKENKRKVRYRAKESMKLDGMENIDLGDDIGDKVDNIVEEDLEGGYVHVEVLSDPDVVISPATSDSVDDAIDNGGYVAIAMRMSKGEVQRYIDDGTFKKEQGEALLKGFTSNESGAGRRANIRKENASAAGIKTQGAGKFALVYQVWSKLKVSGEKRICVTWFGGRDIVLSCKRNPYFCDKVPVISCPVKKVSGVFKGMSQVAPCAPMQYAANDAANLGMDSGMFSLMPIVMTDPDKDPRYGSMVMNMAAIWQTSPQDTQFVNFPQLWQDAFEIVAIAQTTIFQTLGVNPAMITQSNKKKQSQAEIANEQSVDVLTTADAVTVLEEGILTPLVERIYDYDSQFRTESVSVRAYGQMGKRAIMEEIEPIQENNKYSFRWFGVEQARSSQRVQQQITFANVLGKIPPQMMQGRRLDMVPLLESASENIFGPRLAPLVFLDERDKLTMSPEQENMMIMNGQDAPVHLLDDDIEHLMSHVPLVKQDKSGRMLAHVLAHQQQLQQKQQQSNILRSGGSPASGGPGGARPVQAGASPSGPSNQKNPPGSLPADQMHDPSSMPRRM